MPVRIDDETETADLVFVGRNEEPALLGLSVPVAAKGRDDLHMTAVVLGPDGGDHNPVARVPREVRAQLDRFGRGARVCAPRHRLLFLLLVRLF